MKYLAGDGRAFLGTATLTIDAFQNAIGFQRR